MTDSTRSMRATANVLAIVPIVAPPSLDAPDAGRFLEMVALGNLVCFHDTGHHDLDQEPAEMLGFWHDTADWTHVGFYAVADDRLIGAVTGMLANEAGGVTLEFDLFVDPAHRGEGAELALLQAIERVAREHRRTIVQTWTLHRPHQDGRRLASPTGYGSVPADDPQARFLVEQGYALGQVERNSAFDLHGSFAVTEHKLAEAIAAAGGDYRLVQWLSPTPPEFVDGFARVLARMSTDAPQGDLVIDEQTWDAARVQRRDARLAAQKLMVSVSAVVHEPTGEIVAYNELVIGEDRSAATQQYGTLVLREHRGHRLGTIVKCANLVRWRELVPESPRVSTFNAEENRPMLDINEAIGFTAVSYAGAWKKALS